jgi:alcohol dehydrogenase
LVIQYSKAAGFHTTGITRSKDIEEVARKLGADMVANNGGMLKQSDGGGADIILVTNNSYKVATEALRGLRPNGRMILMGISAEPLVVTSRIIENRCRIIGSMQNGQEYLYEALDYVAKGKVKVIAETYSLDDIVQAYQRVASGNARFREVIRN